LDYLPHRTLREPSDELLAGVVDWWPNPRLRRLPRPASQTDGTENQTLVWDAV